MSQSDWPSFDRPPVVAFVDVDGTLLAQTTTFLFARILYRRGLIRRSFFLRALYHGLQHRFGRLDYGRLIAIGLNYIARIPVIELERIAYENFAEFVRPRLYEGVVDHMNSLRRGGTAIVLVSSSPRLVIEPLSIYLGCSDVLTTPVLIERGRLVGMGSGPPCYGEGKLYWAQEWAQQRGIAMQDTVAYADNWSDRALLEHVGRAVVVHPRGRLLRMARSRGWDIVRPRRPSGIKPLSDIKFSR
jgi:HAD superfamily hydrolase (TIGR01490 family)